MKKFPRVLSYLLIFAIVFFFGWQSSSYYTSQKLPSGNEIPGSNPSSLIVNTGKEEADLAIFWQVWKKLFNHYVDETSLDKQQMVYGAIKGMVKSLNDPYTDYMTPEETKEFDHNLNGELEGIGAELTVKDQALVVVSPIKNSPAEQAGIKAGDIIYKIDGEITADMSLFEAIMKIRGDKGTNVVLTIIREGNDEPFEVSITRATVNIESVTMEEKNDGIFYISINQFNDKTLPEFEEKVRQLLLKDPKGIIIDLRNNGGGYLEISVDILAKFLEGKKTAVIIRRREQVKDEVLYVQEKAQLPDLPLVVLINEGSASASEIVAGALQDYKRAILMGVTSFGKGSVQEIDELSDGSSLRMTIAKWYTPNGRSVDKIGLEPDIKVEMKSEDVEKEIDTQLEAALNYLEGIIKR